MSCLGHPLSRMSKRFSVMPGFGPAADPLLFRQKLAKPLTPKLATLEVSNANLRSADQLALLKQDPRHDTSVRHRGQSAGVGR